MSLSANPGTPPQRPAQQAEQPAYPAADARLAGRLLLASVAAAALVVPAGVLLFLVRSRWGPMERLDQGVADALHREVLATPELAGVLRAVGVLTHPWGVRLVALAVAVAVWRRGRRRLAWWLLVTMAVGGLLGVVLKLVVQRARPVLAEPVASAGGYSFPSGHALNSMLLAAALLVLAAPVPRGPRRAGAWLGALTFVLLVGLDRVALGVHYVSDVLAGWLVALAVVAFTVVGFAGWRREEHLTPASPERGLDPGPARPRDALPPVSSDRSWARSLLAILWRLLAGWLLVLAVVVATGLTLAAVGPDVPGLASEDDLDVALVGLRTPVLDDVTSGFSHLANTGAIVTTMVVAAVLLRRLLHRWRESLFVVSATLGQSAVFLVTTLLVSRERPHVAHLDRSPPTSSFPSGHTGAAIALYAALAVVVLRRTRRRWVQAVSVTALVSIPVLVAVSRLYRGMHHPTDVVGSLLCAGLVLAVAHVVVMRRPLPEDVAT